MANTMTSNRLTQIANVIVSEFKAISTSYSILLVLVGGIFIYGFLYNIMYAPNIVTNTPVAVVDHSNTEMSRSFIRYMNATPQISIYGEAMNMVEAKEWMKENKVMGIIYLPDKFEKKIYEGESTTFPFYITTDAFLYYEALQKACANVVLAFNEEYQPVEALQLPPESLIAATTSTPILPVGTALYNYTEGYGSYLIPAVLMIILFQTLNILIGMLSGSETRLKTLRQYEIWGKAWGNAVNIIAGKTFVYCFIYGIFAYFFFAVLPMCFSLPSIGKALDIVIIMALYLPATCFFGLALSKWYNDAEAPLLIIAFFSVPLVFLSGVSYPLELMPWYWQATHFVIPATPATLAYVKINSMGASIADVKEEFITLCCQFVVYFILCVWVYRSKLLRVNGK